MLVDRLEAVTVCVNYSDFLRETLPWNVRHFDRIVVVTSREDKKTQDVCRHLGVECRPTNLFTRDGQFSKARGIDFGLANLRGDGWVVHLDADVWMPPLTRHLLSHTDLDPNCIYGCDRVNCVGYENWQKFLSSHAMHQQQHVQDCLVVPPPFPMGARISLKHYGGFVPIGFFQMWHHGRCPYRYPVHHGGAERTDVLHSLQWDAHHRRLLPELIVIHLESEASHMGVNWGGRKTKEFAPERGRDDYKKTHRSNGYCGR